MNGMLKGNSLESQVILITGGGTGLGKSMAAYFSELGARVIIASRKLEVLEDTASEISKKTGNEVLPLKCDVRNYEEVEQAVRSGIDHFKRITGLCNNAAGNFISPTERLSHRAFDVIVDIVLKGTYNCILAMGKHWIDNKQAGVILNIVTTYAWTGSGYVVPSAAGKAGVLALTRSLAVEWARYNIRSNAIAPGPFPTKGAWERLLPGILKKKFDPAKRVPVKRVGEPQELANLAAYLMSGYSSYINGEVVTIDGGEWLKGAGQFNDLQKIPKKMWDLWETMLKKK